MSPQATASHAAATAVPANALSRVERVNFGELIGGFPCGFSALTKRKKGAELSLGALLSFVAPTGELLQQRHGKAGPPAVKPQVSRQAEALAPFWQLKRDMAAPEGKLVALRPPSTCELVVKVGKPALIAATQAPSGEPAPVNGAALQAAVESEPQ